MEGELRTHQLASTVPWRSVPRAEIDRKIGIAFADFYDRLLDSYLQPTGDRSVQVEEALQKLPRLLRPLFRKALAAIEQEASVNQALVEAHRGNEAVFLLGDQLKEHPAAAEKILPRAASETTLVQLAPGFYLLVMRESLFRLFGEHDVILKGGAAYAYVELGRDRPKFMVVPADELGERAERHELRHILWCFLRQADFVRRSTEEGTMAKGFESFRDEFMAYIIGDAGMPSSGKYLVYEDDLELEKTGDSLRLLSSAAITFSWKNKVDARALAHAAMVSRNFKEFTNEIHRMLPIQQELDVQGLTHLLEMCDETMPGGERGVVVARQLVKTRSLRASTEVRVGVLADPRPRGTLGYLRTTIVGKGQHLKALFGQDSDFAVRQAIRESLRGVWPEEVVNLVTEAPEEITDELLLTDSLRSMISNSISAWNITDPQRWEFHRRLIRLNAENKKAFAGFSADQAGEVKSEYKRAQGFQRPWANQGAITREASYRSELVRALGWARNFDEAKKFAKKQRKFPAALWTVS